MLLICLANGPLHNFIKNGQKSTKKTSLLVHCVRIVYNSDLQKSSRDSVQSRFELH